MKLYTEEQLKQLLNTVVEDMTDLKFNELLNESEIVSIELPSDSLCINCDLSKSTHNVCMDCMIKIGKENIEIPSDEEMRKMAKRICNGHQHAMRYNQMLICCFNMGKSVIEKIQGGNK